MTQYVVIYEKGRRGWGAFSPDIPGCIATGKTRDEVRRRFRQAVAFHIEGLLDAGLSAPKPRCRADIIRVAV